MTDLRLRLRAPNRVLVLAPHPDDESVAAGGALQVAVASGAQVRVAYLTDGENNPWAQRATERRWRISAHDRGRWGARRRHEAIEALRDLGVSSRDATFLGFPDQRVTEALIAEGSSPVQRLADEIASWRPSVLFLPSLADCHPDHSATAVMARLALVRARAAARPFLLEYVVHRMAGFPTQGLDCVCPLSRAERETKRRAILRHVSQLRLRRSLLLGFATRPERFSSSPQPVVNHLTHPMRFLESNGTSCSFSIRRPSRLALGRPVLLLLCQSGERMTTIRIPVAFDAERRPISRLGESTLPGETTSRPCGSWTEITIESPALRHGDVRLAKLDLPRSRHMGLFDRWPWLSCSTGDLAAGLRAAEPDSARSEGPFVALAEG